MNLTLGLALVVGLSASCCAAQAASTGAANAASPLSCAERFQAAGIDPAKLAPGDRGRLEGHDFVVARDDTSADRICARIDAEAQKTQALRAQLEATTARLNKAQDQLSELGSGGPLKENYLIVDGVLLGWAVIASIWAGYLAGRLDPRRH